MFERAPSGMARKAWLTMDQWALVRERATGALREIGTLLVAFAPLDFTMSERAGGWSLAGFLVAGGIAFAIAVAMELRGKS